MADSNVSALAVFDNGTQINYLEKDGEILFTAEEIGRHLGYTNPAKSINKLFLAHHSELKLYAVGTKTVQTDGKAYETRAFSEEGVYILSMLARTNEAKRFRARVALLLRRIRSEAQQRAVELARQAALEAARADAAADRERHRGTVRKVFDLSPSDRVRMRKILGYRKRGFSRAEIAKVMGMPSQTVNRSLGYARSLGLLDGEA